MNITLSPEHAAYITKYAALTGYTQEEFVSWLLADYLNQFKEDDPHDTFFRDTIGSMYFKDRESAERVQSWLLEELVRTDYARLEDIESRINSNPGGTFDVYMTVPHWKEGERRRVA
jgi:hypothetical protein